jgi:alkylation response protein AidB-like acyl-CoA dehydrogenase
MSFVQEAPRLAHPYRDDRLLRPWLALALPGDRFDAIEADLDALADYATMAYRRRQRSPAREPVLTQWDAWGNRVDRIELTPAWEEGAAITTRHRILAAGHEDHAHARLEQFARVYLYHVASEFYTCPLAMTDGAATALKASGNRALIERALPRFLATDPAQFWLSGQWMTETHGGSDVGNTETVARRDDTGQWRLYGRKWFSSAVVGEAAMALARPEGAGGGTGALGLFFVETKDANGHWQGVQIDRLKQKLGTRELPTAEIHLDGLPATPVGPLEHGVRQVAPMLNVTRTWNAVCAVASMSRAIALARDYAGRRQAFGRSLIEQPLHRHTLAGMQAEFEAAFALAFHVAGMLGKSEHDAASPGDLALLRVLTPASKLWTAKLAVKITSEALECFGGAGYIEDTGLPQLLRDAQVYPIWEGTSNVLALDVLRALRGVEFAQLRRGMQSLSASAPPSVTAAIGSALDHVARMLERATDPDALEISARSVAITLARTAAAAAMTRRLPATGQAAPYTGLALKRFLSHGLERAAIVDPESDIALARG